MAIQTNRSIFNRPNREEDLQWNPNSLQASLNWWQPTQADPNVINPVPTTQPKTSITVRGLSGLQRKIALKQPTATPATGSKPMSVQKYDSANKQFIDTIQSSKIDPNQYSWSLKTQQARSWAYNAWQLYNSQVEQAVTTNQFEKADIDLANDQFRTNFKNADYVDKLTTWVQDQYRMWVRDPSQIAKNLWMSLDDVNLVTQGRWHEILQFSDRKMDELSKWYQWNTEDLDIQKQRALQDHEVTKARVDQNYKWNMDDLQKDFWLANQLARKVGAWSGAILSSWYQEWMSVMRQAFDTTMSRLAVNHENDTYDLIKNKERILQDIDTNISRLKYTHDQNIKANKEEALGVIASLRSKYQISDTNFLQSIQQAETNYLANINKVFEYDMSYMKEMMSMYNNEIDNLNTQQQRYMDVYASNPSLANAMYPGLWSQVTEQQAIQQSISTYWSSIWQVQWLEKWVLFLSKTLSSWTNGNRNSCGMVTNDYLTSIGATDGKVWNDLASKTKTINSKTPVVWSVVIMDSKTSPANWHTAIVLWMNNDWSMILADGNGFWAGKNKVWQFTAKIQDWQLIVNGKAQWQVYWFHVPSTMQQQWGQKWYTESQQNMMRQMDAKNLSSTELSTLKTQWLTAQDVYNYKSSRTQNRRQNWLNDDEIKRVNSMADDFYWQATAKTFNKIQEAYSFANSLKWKVKSTDNQALIYAFAKAMDPDSVVREWEYATVQKYSQTRWDKLWMNINRALNWQEFISDEAKKDMVDTIRSKYEASKWQYETERKTYIQRINDYAGNDIWDKVIPSNANVTQWNSVAPANVNDMISTFNNLSKKYESKWKTKIKALPWGKAR